MSKESSFFERFGEARKQFEEDNDSQDGSLTRRTLEKSISTDDEDSYEAGYSDGHDEGYDEGYSEGHSAGYDEGYEDARSEYEKD